MKTFTIDKISWHTEVEGNPETKEKIYLRFYRIACFLQNHGLTNNKIINDYADLTNDFEINSKDLNELGMLFIKECYDKWLKALSKGVNIDKTKILENSLSKINSH